MSIRNLKNSVAAASAGLSIVPVVCSGNGTDTEGTGVDLRGYNRALVQFLVGATAETLSGSLYICLEVEESADNSTFTDCADASLSDTVTGATTGTMAKIISSTADNVLVEAEYKGTSRYIRGVVNLVGNHAAGGTPIACLITPYDGVSIPA